MLTPRRTKPADSPRRQHPIDKPLSEREKEIARIRAAGDSYPAIARRLGITPAYAQSVCQRESVKLYIRQEQLINAQTTKMTRQTVIDGFLEAIEMAKVMAEPMTMIAGWREVGKMCGFYEPEVKTIRYVNGDDPIEKLQTMSMDDLLKMAEETNDLLGIPEGKLGNNVNYPVP